MMCEAYIAEHNWAFELAKKKAGVRDVSSLTPQQLSELCADAELIRRTEVKPSSQERERVEEHESSDSAREHRQRSRG
jgi:hypothetical protein